MSFELAILLLTTNTCNAPDPLLVPIGEAIEEIAVSDDVWSRRPSWDGPYSGTPDETSLYARGMIVILRQEETSHLSPFSILNHATMLDYYRRLARR